MTSPPDFIQWAQDVLVVKGYQLSEQVETIVTTPWSQVLRFASTAGYIYVKKTPIKLSLEAQVIQLLEKDNLALPLVIASNINLHCFIMQDSGDPLRTIFKEGFQATLLIQAIEKYAAIQQASLSEIDNLLALGVPDWRLATFPALYQNLLAQSTFLIEDGLSTAELDTLQQLLPKIHELSQQIAAHKIPSTIDHCDFHDNNILLENNTHKFTIIDWGETVITHPFFSLITCFKKAAYLYHLSEDSADYLELRAACLAPWEGYHTTAELLEIFQLAQKLWLIYSVLGEYRLQMSVPHNAFAAYATRKQRMAQALRELIKIFA